jgi:PiT family inorganic phosphate transporter
VHTQGPVDPLTPVTSSATTGRVGRAERPPQCPSREDAHTNLELVTPILVAVVVLAVFFDYVNGFHDTANAIATSVATRALRPSYAIAMATAFNFIGAFAGTAVAKTIGAGLVNDQSTTQAIVAASLIGAITWNLITWRLGLPSSSSHALIGGLLGATIVGAGFDQLNLSGIWNKVVIPLVTSPIIGFTIALLLMVALYWVFRRAQRRPLARGFRHLQVFSAGFMAFAHGSNDAQKTMGIITLSLVAAGILPDAKVIPWEVIVISATAISLGTAVGGWRIMHTMGHKVVDLEPIHGFAAETTGATVIYGAATLGMPVSTTHVISSAIMGVGSSKGTKGVHWGVARTILIAWVLTIPAAGIFGAASWYVLNALGIS